MSIDETSSGSVDSFDLDHHNGKSKPFNHHQDYSSLKYFPKPCTHNDTSNLKFFILGFLLGLFVGLLFHSSKNMEFEFNDPPYFPNDSIDHINNVIDQYFELGKEMVESFIETCVKLIQRLWGNPEGSSNTQFEMDEIGFEWENQVQLLKRLHEKGNGIRTDLIINNFGTEFDNVNSNWLTTLQMTERLIDDYENIRSKAKHLEANIQIARGVKKVITRSISEAKKLKSIVSAFSSNWGNYELQLQASIASLTTFNSDFEHTVMDIKKEKLLGEIRRVLCEIVELFGVQCNTYKMAYQFTNIEPTQSLDRLQSFIDSVVPFPN